MDEKTFDKLIRQTYSKDARRIKLYENIVFLENLSRAFHGEKDSQTANIVDGSLLKYYEYLGWHLEAAEVAQRLGRRGRAAMYFRKAGEHEIADYLSGKL